MSDELLKQVLEIILPAVASLVAIFFGYLGQKIKAKYEQTANDQIKKQVIDDTVAFVQQVYKDLNGPEKLQKAIERAGAILTEKKIPISSTELNMLIESAVYGLKQGMTETVEIEEKKGKK